MSEIEKTESGEKKFSFFKTAGQILGIFLLGFTIYMLFSTIMLVSLTRPSGEVKVPDFVGEHFSDIYNGLARLELKPELEFRESFEMDDGVVLSQKPEQDTIVRKGSTLRLVVTRNVFTVEVPQLVGMEMHMGINKLKNLHFKERAVSLRTGVISYIPMEDKAEGIIIAQNPRAEEKVSPFQRVNLLVSAGKTGENGVMPQLKDQSIDIAYELLAARGMKVVQNIVKTADPDKSGLVAGHTPAAGSAVKKDSTARLTVLYYPLQDHPYYASEKVTWAIPSGEGPGLYEALVEDMDSRRICFAQNMKGGDTIEFVFFRTGNARILFTKDKTQVGVTTIDVE